MKIIVGEHKLVGFIDLLRGLINYRLAILFCAVSIALSGCVKYDTGITFSSLNAGEIVEHIQLGEQLKKFNQQAVQTWITSIEQRTQQAEGRIEHISDRELKVIIPFNNAQELVAKVERYFNPQPTTTSQKSTFNAHLQIKQSNFLVAVRNQLIYDIDLRSLSSQSSNSTAAAPLNNAVNLNFQLTSPWGVKNSTSSGIIIGTSTTTDRQMDWHLQPGKLNHLAAIFWLPNPLGIGAIAIILISGAGYYLKYHQLPGQLQSK